MASITRRPPDVARRSPSDKDVADVLAAAARLRHIRSTASPTGAPVDEALSAALRVLADEVGRTGEALASRPDGEPARPGTGAELARPCVVVVDDDPVARELTREILAEDFEVFATADPFEALRLARRPADALVTDLHMPRIDGLALLQLVRAEPATAGVPCILLTADPAQLEKLLAFDHGAADYLTKPVDAGELVVRLLTRIGDARRLRAERLLQETDELTRLPNRRALRRALSRAHEECRAGSGPLTVVMIDADGLKRINDGFGHAAGDRAIRAVADALRRTKRDGDTATRLGGDEFAVVMPCADLEGAERFVARVREALRAAPLDGFADPIELRVSAGAAALAPGETLDALLERADQALYACKRGRSGAS